MSSNFELLRSIRLLQDKGEKPSSFVITAIVCIGFAFLFFFMYYMSRRFNRRYVKTTYSEKF